MKGSIMAILLAVFMLATFAACGGGPAEETGPVAVTLLVTLQDGTQNAHEITTDKASLGEALDAEGLIERDDKGMIIAVAGVEANWEADQAYWAIYVNDEYAMKGADDLPLASGSVYEFRYTKG